MTDKAKPDFQFIASQLRQPSGDYAAKIVKDMDNANESLYNLTLDTMDLQPNESILEIGFGSGAFMHRIFEKIPDANVSGLDFSSEMVESAKTNNKDMVAAGQLVLEHGSSDKMPFKNGSFDKVFCNMVIFFWDDPAKHLGEVRRVLKPGGIFYTGIRPKNIMEKFPFTQFGFNLYEPEEWIGILENNGFKLLKVADQTDPENIDIPFRLQSYCIAAQTKSI